MRTIKFRAWDKKNEEMLTDEWCANNFTSLKNDIEWTGEEYENRDTAYCLMQFTGLKDSKGVEIYEGDRVKDKYNKIGVVEYYLPFAGFIAKHKIGTNDPANERVLHIQLDQARNEFEVIGNIYEESK